MLAKRSKEDDKKADLEEENNKEDKKVKVIVKPVLKELELTSFSPDLKEPKKTAIEMSPIDLLSKDIESMYNKYLNHKLLKRSSSKDAVIVDRTMNEMKEILEITKSLVESSENGDHEQKIKEILNYLGKVNIIVPKRIGSDIYSSLDSHMEKTYGMEAQPATPLSGQPPGTYFPPEESLTLIDVYKKIHNYYTSFGWTFSYPLSNQEDKTEQVMSDGIGKFQNDKSISGVKDDKDKITIKDAKGEILKDDKGKITIKDANDFHRGYTIEGHAFSYGELSKVLKAMDDLVDKADGYHENDKELLKQWLKLNGGQATNVFFENLLAVDKDLQGLQGQEKDSEDYSAIGCDIKFGNWTISNGKLQLEYSMTAKTIVMSGEEGNTFLINNNKGGAELLKDPPEAMDLKQRPPVMRVYAKMELEIVTKEDKKVVQPKISELKLISHIKDKHIKSPEEKGIPRRVEKVRNDEYDEDKSDDMKKNVKVPNAKG